MSRTTNRYWNETLVMSLLKDAAAIHHRLPPVKVSGYRSSWVETMKDDWDRYYRMVNGKTKLGSPMPAEVSYSDEVLTWLQWLDTHQQKIIFMRANNIPWKVITDQLDKCKTTLWYDMKNGLSEIGIRLEEKDPQGEYYRHLRCRAIGTFEHLQTH